MAGGVRLFKIGEFAYFFCFAFLEYDSCTMKRGTKKTTDLFEIVSSCSGRLTMFDRLRAWQLSQTSMGAELPMPEGSGRGP